MISRRSYFATISELCVKYEVTPRALRYYEQRGLLKPSRIGQRRFYTEKDELRLQLIKKGKRLGFSLAEIHHIIHSRAHSGKASMKSKDFAEFLSKDQLNARVELLERRREAVSEALHDLYRLHAFSR